MTSTLSILTDEELIEAYLKSQSKSYFDEIFCRYADKVYAKSISMLQDASLAEDSVQEIFMKILMNLSKFKGDAKFSTWLYSITYNYCIDYLRKSKRVHFVSDEEIYEVELEDEISDKELLEIEIDRLDVIMKEADPKDRAILIMKYVDDMSIKEMAEVLNRSESAIKMGIMRAKQRVRTIYHSYYAN